MSDVPDKKRRTRDDGKDKEAFPPRGPFAPPTPAEAEQERGKPMAVARDEETTHDFFVPTSAPTDDVVDEDMAGAPSDGDAARATPSGRDVARRDDENLAMETPPDYEPTAHGFRRLRDDDEDES